MLPKFFRSIVRSRIVRCSVTPSTTMPLALSFKSEELTLPVRTLLSQFSRLSALITIWPLEPVGVTSAMSSTSPASVMLSTSTAFSISVALSITVSVTFSFSTVVPVVSVSASNPVSVSSPVSASVSASFGSTAGSTAGSALLSASAFGSATVSVSASVLVSVSVSSPGSVPVSVSSAASLIPTSGVSANGSNSVMAAVFSGPPDASACAAYVVSEETSTDVTAINAARKIPSARFPRFLFLIYVLLPAAQSAVLSDDTCSLAILVVSFYKKETTMSNTLLFFLCISL